MNRHGLEIRFSPSTDMISDFMKKPLVGTNLKKQSEKIKKDSMT